jgi:hypothetical protein
MDSSIAVWEDEGGAFGPVGSNAREVTGRYRTLWIGVLYAITTVALECPPNRMAALIQMKTAGHPDGMAQPGSPSCAAVERDFADTRFNELLYYRSAWLPATQIEVQLDYPAASETITVTSMPRKAVGGPE